MRTKKRYTNTTVTHRPDHDAAKVRAAGRAGQPIAVRICPGCRRRNAGVPHGFVHVDGEFVAPHRGDILRLLRNEVDRAAEDNPLAQVLDWGEDGMGGLLVTTTEHLAIRAGSGTGKGV